MVRVILLGCGKIGSVIARDLSKTLEMEFTAADKSGSMARATAESVGGEWIAVDVMDSSRLVRVLEDYDMVLGALPGDYGFRAIKAAIEAGVDMVDISFTPENPLDLNDTAEERGVTVVPDCGIAPGLSNILVGYGSSKLGKLKRANIMVGGLPEAPVPPLGYTITWSAEGLIDEYIRDAHIIKNGEIVAVPALSGLEEVEFPKVGRLEGFYTDGLRTLIKTMQGIDDMWEKTLRYPGHVEKVKLLRELGFFSDKSICIDDREVAPRMLTAKLFDEKLRIKGVGDLLAMKILLESDEDTLEFTILDRYNEEEDTTAMARTTGYTASIVANMIAEGDVSMNGIVPPERLGINGKNAERIISGLKKRGVDIRKSRR
ncbi:MAG: saccharopine dehydrogenase family protein [Candidatus Bathyarchaeia archaeon]